MDDSDDSDSEVEISRKRKLNILEDEDSDESDDDEDYESESDGEDESDDSVDNPGDEITLPDDTNNDQCAICLMEFTDQKLGVPNNCTHVFCLVCIQEWAKNINTCPVGRKVFHTISVKRTKNGVTIEEIKVKDRTQVKEEEYEDPTTCEICGIGDREDRMLLCDRCDRGFHLECLTPPLDSVPDEEWFCHDCFIDHTDNTQEHDTVDYSQHVIAFSDDEFPTFELQSRSTASSSISSNSRASTSQQRRARTVATSRARRQRRTTQTRRPTGGQRSKKKKSKKTKSSSKGATTTNTRTLKPRKRKKRKKSSKKKIKYNENFHQNTARYLLPSEMEPTATFSLFGSDFDLEYLPVIERPAVPISKQSSPPRSSTPSNPDVLGSIFTGLNTLHSASLSVDNKGRVKSEDNNPTNQSSISKSTLKIPTTSRQTTSLSGGRLDTCCRTKISDDESIHGNVHKQSTFSKTEKSHENESTSRKLINEKRLVRFNASTSEPAFAKLKVDSSSFADSRKISRKFDPEKETKLRCKGNKSSTSILASPTSSCSLSETALKTSHQPSLVSFKIPKKPSASTSNLTPAVSKSTKTFRVKFATKAKSSMKSPVNTSQSKIARRKFKVPNVPKESYGILHLLPAEVGRSPMKQTENDSAGNTSNERVENYNSQSSVTHSTVSNTLDVSKTIDKKSSESASEILNSSSTLNPSANLRYVNKASTFLHTSGHQNFSSNVMITGNVNNENSSLDLTSSSSSQTVRHVEPSRPVAVVRPTKIDDGQETSSLEAEVAQRRQEGIKRLQRREVICEEVKKALKPFYKHREISKESYKYIFSRAAEKISKSTLPVVSRDVASLVRNYVKKLKGRQNQPTL